MRYAAVDLGAESGRVGVSEYGGDLLSLEIAPRFANHPVQQADSLHWDVRHLLDETIRGLRKAGDIAGIGVDAWGCDYALFDEDGVMLGEPFHHRDPRTWSGVQRAFALVPKEELYGRTGTQHLRFNTVFQLMADAEAGVDLERARRIALIPDLLNFWLAGVLVNEATVASTTGLTSATSRTWERTLVERLGLPAAPFSHELVEPGALLGELDACHGVDSAPHVRAVAGHDTASAFATATSSPNAGVVSCGTWSLVGIEFRQPRLGGNARETSMGTN
jgi:rhamnulokinase